MTMPSFGQLPQSSVKKVLFPTDSTPLFRPYGCSTAYNVLEYFLGTPDIATQVWLFISFSY